MLKYGYRSEVPFGEGFRDAISVMVHECYDWDADFDEEERAYMCPQCHHDIVSSC